jgi:hypothetical protein
MRRLARVMVAVVLFAVAVALGLWGLLLVLYNGEGPHGSETYVTLFGRQIEADVVGGITMAMAMAVAALGVLAVLFTRPRH